MNEKKRNVNIELVRILACISVIALHTWKGSGIDEVPTVIKGVIRVFEKHNVPLFFIIMGFFMFRGNKSYWVKVKDLINRIIIPSLVALVFYEFMQGVLEGNMSLQDAFTAPLFKLASIFKLIVSTSPGYNPTLWFVYEYIRIVLLAPFIALLCKEEKEIVCPH